MTTTSNHKTVYVVREHWLRGEGRGFLREPVTGKHCCLGFISLAFGVQREEMTSRQIPRELPQKSREKLPPWMRMASTENPDAPAMVTLCAAVNDDCGISDENREASLRTLAWMQGIDLRFVDHASRKWLDRQP